MKKKYRLLILFLVGCLAATGLGVGIANATTTPMQTWGYAQFIDPTGHGEPVPIGTEIKVYIGANTIPSGVTNTTTPGFYGSMMIVGDTSQYGEELHYTLDGYPAIKNGPDSGVFGIENQIVNLYADKHNTLPLPVINSTHTWKFTKAGFYPKHLPDKYLGTVNLSSLQDVPEEMQGVYYFNVPTLTWLFWHPEAPGTTLAYLEGGMVADYMVASAGACTWEIELQ